ncbi:hypothetical protein FHETE_7488 [Fusarium heterosporum]|uniref:Azaphilone pigments biosynthesis cluster protein L N-terminal domain-containing protein n=1 Tax=Fusarium heterosporum TaxID=42747 RepID=A0A8H5T6F7_FUSHE|nr:hypothetical protein FHETE_7488 [Fusarium heterosporum]
MSDPLSIASALIAIVTATLQSSKILYETIRSFRNHQTAVSDLVRELKGLESVLCPLQDHVRADETAFLPLKFPLIQCREACVRFQALVEKSSRRTQGASRTSFRDWARLTFMNGDVVSFKELLAGYKSTITIALADANLRSSKVTLEVLNDYKNLICDTKLDLEKHLKDIDSKLHEIVSQNRASDINRNRINLRRVENEKESTERCLEYCKHLLEQIDGMHFQPVFNDSTLNTTTTTITTQNMTLADSLTISTLKMCSHNLSNTINQLVAHRSDADKNLRLTSSGQGHSSGSDPSGDYQTLQNELESTRQCLSVCDRASDWASSGRVHIVEDIAIGNDGKQICVSTLGDLFKITKATAGHGSLQFFGSVSEGSLNEILRSQNQWQEVHHDSTINEVCVSAGHARSTS